MKFQITLLKQDCKNKFWHAAKYLTHLFLSGPTTGVWDSFDILSLIQNVSLGGLCTEVLSYSFKWNNGQQSTDPVFQGKQCCAEWPVGKSVRSWDDGGIRKVILCSQEYSLAPAPKLGKTSSSMLWHQVSKTGGEACEFCRVLEKARFPSLLGV